VCCVDRLRTPPILGGVGLAAVANEMLTTLDGKEVPSGLIGRISMTPGPRPRTMRVIGVERGSAAEKAGLKTGDVIVRFDGVVPAVPNMQALEAREAPEPGYVLEVQLGDGRMIRIIAAKFD
jgi:S1-C subfamily serine protease